MARAPTPADLALIDPDGSFRLRLARDRDAIAALMDQGDTSQLEPVVHRLAGAAATFGYIEIGHIAGELDDAFVAARKSGAPPPDVTPLVTALTATLQR